MKKRIFILAAALALSSGSGALAADPSYADGAVSVDASDYSTVMVVKGIGENINNISAEDIVYIDQAEDVYGAAASFLLKASAAYSPGIYTVKMAGASAGVYTGTFEILKEDIAMAYLAKENVTSETYDISFVTEKAVALNTYNSIKLAYDGSVIGGISIDYKNIIGDVKFGVRIANVDIAKYPDAEKFSLYLSTDVPMENNKVRVV